MDRQTPLSPVSGLWCVWMVGQPGDAQVGEEGSGEDKH